MNKSCNRCTSHTRFKTRSQVPFISSLLIIIIPKCPFCIMAYSSAITMCGGKSIYMAQNNWISHIPLLLSILILYLLIRNYKDQRTIFAILFAVMGFVLLMLVHRYILISDFYNLGAVFLIFSIWLNGSLLSFVSNLSTRIKNRKILWHS